MFVEAEHHAVFAPADGRPWKDVTPCEIPGSRRRLFLPDNAAVYDFENPGQLRDNVRMALSNSPLVPEMFDAAAERVRILNSIPGVGAVTASLETARSLQATTLKVMELQHEIGMTHTPPRTPCFCGRPSQAPPSSCNPLGCVRPVGGPIGSGKVVCALFFSEGETPSISVPCPSPSQPRVDDDSPAFACSPSFTSRC